MHWRIGLKFKPHSMINTTAPEPAYTGCKGYRTSQVCFSQSSFEKWNRKRGNNSILEGGNNLMQRCPLPSSNKHTYFSHWACAWYHQSRDCVCANPHGRCLEGHTKHCFLLWRAAIILNVLSTAKCLIYKPIFMATVHTHTENLQTILPSSLQYINLQHSWQSI